MALNYESQKCVLQIGKRFFVRFSPTTGNIQTAAYVGGGRLFRGLYDADMPRIVRALQARGVNPVIVRLRLSLDCDTSAILDDEAQSLDCDTSPILDDEAQSLGCDTSAILDDEAQSLDCDTSAILDDEAQSLDFPNIGVLSAFDLLPSEIVDDDSESLELDESSVSDGAFSPDDDDFPLFPGLDL